MRPVRPEHVIAFGCDARVALSASCSGATMSSFDLREELEAIKSIADYETPNNCDVISMSPHEVDDILSRA